METEKVLETQVETEVKQDTVLEQPAEAVAAPVETAAQLSFKQLREKAERLERERDEYYRKNQQYENRQPVERGDEEENYPINNDDLVEGKHLKAYEKKLKKLEDSFTKSQKKAEEAFSESRIRSEFPDFDKVVSQDSLYILQSQFPELAASINANPDLYSKAKAAHQAITKLNINPNDFSSQDKAINKNLSKPQNVNAVSPQQGESALNKANAFANGLTEDDKKRLYAEMCRYADM